MSDDAGDEPIRPSPFTEVLTKTLKSIGTRKAVDMEIEKELRRRLIDEGVALRLQRMRGLGSDIFEEHSVIRFRVQFEDGKTYTYAAIKAGGRWHTTGAYSRSLSWDELMNFIASSSATEVGYVKLAVDGSVTTDQSD